MCQIVVAINKIDKPDANPDESNRNLRNTDLSPVEWGGETEMVQVSAKNGRMWTLCWKPFFLPSDR